MDFLRKAAVKLLNFGDEVKLLVLDLLDVANSPENTFDLLDYVLIFLNRKHYQYYRKTIHYNFIRIKSARANS